MNHERTNTPMPYRLAWKRPAEAARWDAGWCMISLAGSDTGPDPARPLRPTPVPVDGAPFGLGAAARHDGARGADGVEPEPLRRAAQGRARRREGFHSGRAGCGPEQRPRRRGEAAREPRTPGAV